MILNTRNFFLYLLCVAVLVLAIAVTAVYKQSETSDFDDHVYPPPVTTISNEAAVIGAVTLNREEKLVTMREKVVGSLAGTTPEPIAEEESVLENSEIGSAGSGHTEVLITTSEDRCDMYALYQGVWATQGLAFSVVEGARLLQREVGTSSVETVLQLPLRSFPLPAKSCIPSDVIGVALDGSLIRNGEVGLYSIFGQETLIGYALDGFPIYGVTDGQVDVCGGLMVDGHYQYNLRKDNLTILNCYSGVPIIL